MVGAAAGAGAEARTAAAFKEGVPSDMEVWSRRSNPNVQGPAGAAREVGGVDISYAERHLFDEAHARKGTGEHGVGGAVATPATERSFRYRVVGCATFEFTSHDPWV